MRVGLCTPCYSGFVHHQHMLSVIATMKLAARSGININHYTAPNCPVLPRVRNRLVASALTGGCDWVVFVDDDIAWEAADFFKLMEHGVEVVGAAPPKRHKRWDESAAPVVKFLDGDSVKGVKTKAGRIWQASALACGFLAIRSDVFSQIKGKTVPFFSEGDTNAETRTWFWHDVIDVDGRLMDEGEDYNFCRKWREVGGNCWVDPDIRVRHYVGNLCHDVCLADMEKKVAA